MSDVVPTTPDDNDLNSWIYSLPDPEPVDSDVRREMTSSDLARQRGIDDAIRQNELRKAEQERAHQRFLQDEAERERQKAIEDEERRIADEEYSERERQNFNSLSELTYIEGNNVRAVW